MSRVRHSAGREIDRGTHEEDHGGEEERVPEDPYPPCEERLHDERDERAHDRHAEPRVVELDELAGHAIVVHVVVERSIGREPSLDPFVDQEPVHCKFGAKAGRER